MSLSNPIAGDARIEYSQSKLFFLLAKDNSEKVIRQLQKNLITMMFNAWGHLNQIHRATRHGESQSVTIWEQMRPV